MYDKTERFFLGSRMLWK